MNITKLQLLTDDIQATTIFYRDVLGLPLRSAHASAVIFIAGSTELVFQQSDNLQPRFITSLLPYLPISCMKQ